jgi:hypothetical protein
MKRIEQPKKKELTKREQLEKQTSRVWLRAGHPRYMLTEMSDDELNSLVAMEDPQHFGCVCEGFADKIKAFVDEYYESRKASGPEQDEEPQGFGLEVPTDGTVTDNPKQPDPAPIQQVVPQQLAPETEE